MSDPARRRATYDDLLAVPDHLVLADHASGVEVRAEPFDALPWNLGLLLWAR